MVVELEYSRVGCKQQLGEGDFKEFLVQLSADRDFGSTAYFARSELNRTGRPTIKWSSSGTDWTFGLA